MEPAEASHVLQDQSEGVPGSLAEEGVSEGDLDVCILRDELDALFHDPEEVAREAEQHLDNRVFLGDTHLLAIVLEEESEHLANGDQESTKGNGTHMEAEGPVGGTTDRTLTVSV